MDFGARQVSFTSSSASWKSCDVVSDQFPAGLRVLVVDDDPTCLRILEKMLKKCLYEVTTSNRAEVALKLLRENKNGYDIVLSDVHMPDMDGFKLLEHVGLEMDLPVIMMSADDSKHVVMKGVTHGACDYLIKPVSIEALKNIWQHVVRKRKHEWKEKEAEQSASVEEQKPPEDIDCSSSANEGSWKSSKRRKDEEDEGEERDDSSTLKKPRVVWSVELHQQFVNAVNLLGIDKAVPKKILELMNVPGLTRENVASHLQKYRLYLRRLSGVQQHQNGLGTSFPGPPDATFGPISSLELQALAASGHLPPHSFATIQAAALGRATTKSPISVPDQRNIFSFENPKLNNPKQVNLLHGIPTNMDSKQLASLHQSAAQSFSNVHMNLHSQASQSNSLLKQMLQPIKESLLPNFSAHAVSSHVIPGIRGPAHGNNSPSPVSNARMSTPTSKIQDEVSSENNESRRFVPNNNVFGDLNQNRVQDCHLQNVVSAFEAPRRSNVHGALNGLPPVLIQPGVSSNQKGGQSNMLNTNPQLNSSFAGNQLRNMAVRLPDLRFQNGLLPEQFGQEDLMSALLKQQEVLGPVENEFGFDGYPLDNLPVSRAHAS